MSYKYIPGVEAFIADLRRHGAKIAVVTSSNEDKMQNVYNAHPEFKGMVDRILTGEMFAQACSRLFPVGYGSIQCDSRKHLRI
jgi:beta-phosphoglucomutase